MELVESMALLEWFANNYKNFGTLYKYIPNFPIVGKSLTFINEFTILPLTIYDFFNNTLYFK